MNFIASSGVLTSDGSSGYFGKSSMPKR